MVLDDECLNLIKSIGEEWNKAERATKEAEQVEKKIINPAIYELRYAGRRLIEAFACLSKNEKASAIKFLQDAEFNCMRSRHDAVDAAMAKIAADLDIAIEKLGAKAVIESFPKWGELYGALELIRANIADSREDRENRDKIYESIEKDNLSQIVSLYREFKASEPLMFKKAQRDRRNVTLSLIFGGTGVSIAIMSLLYNIFKS